MWLIVNKDKFAERDTENDQVYFRASNYIVDMRLGKSNLSEINYLKKVELICIQDDNFSG